MKLTTIALASAFALSSTFALAYTNHHRTHHHRYHGYHGTVGMSSAPTYRGSTNYGGYGAGNPNNRGGLVGGGDSGTYRP
ncbi:hypothetical protein SAMN05443248_3768 [Bradyrhizobium erythrophlei]|jgi:hypothetical protein|uniref:Uncharacterized protein n=1 Tax=Bradyrhizobium erythrophlei TaxID=1437360 RepID=A0A1M5QEY8_9BRAD|nr:hypothetical protein SAMN05443248_3768 [Bradyrhizobium erythrophlei]